jgi:hypothetical protein
MNRSSKRPLRRTIRGARPFFFEDSATDKVLSMIVTLASEVWTLRERLAALEAIGVRRGSLAAGEIDAFEFSPEQETQLAAQRKELIDNVFRVLQERVDGAATRGSVKKRSRKRS